MANHTTRMKRAVKSSARIKASGRLHMYIHRTPRHIYAQIVAHEGKASRVLVSAASVEKEVREAHTVTGNVDCAKAVGELIAKRAKEKDISEIGFDRRGFSYHGRVKALADAAREGGLKF